MSEQQAEPNVPAAQEEGAEGGFWKRMFGGGAKPDAKDLPAVAAPEPGELGPSRPKSPGRTEKKKNAPRAPKQDDEQQRRFARAAMLRRERLARTIGERVEQVIVDRIAQGEDRLVEAQEGMAYGMGEVKGLLGSIGKNLDDQASRGERVARILEGLPGASEREREALLEVARAIEDQGAGTQGGLEAVRSLLSQVGQGLDAQGARAERTAKILETLPEVARRETEALDGVALSLDHHGRGLRDGLEAVHGTLSALGRDLDLQGRREQETIEHVARVLEGQSGTQLALAESVRGVPQVLAIARDSQRAAEERLHALRDVKQELELQRDQRERMIETLRATSARFEERFVQLEVQLQLNAAQARADASNMRLTFEGIGERLAEQSRSEAVREEARARRIEQGLGDVSRRLGESNTLHAAGIASQGQALEALQDAHIELMDAFQTAQSRAIGEVQRIHDETHRRAEQLAWRSRLSLVGSAGLVAMAVFFGFAQASPPPVIVVPSESVAEAPRDPSSGPTTLPAGFRREPAGAPSAPDERQPAGPFADEAAARKDDDEDAR